MNWYSKYKLAQGYGQPSHYLEIGHDDISEGDEASWLWMYADGQIQTYQVKGHDDLHDSVWGSSNNFTGRYDGQRKQISIYPPNHTTRQVPSFLIRMLERKFPEAIGTYFFDWAGKPLPV